MVTFADTMSHTKNPLWKCILLYIPSQLFGLVSWLRNKGFDYHILSARKFDLPTICIGNISVGGTGKTPHTEYLIELLNNKKHVAVLSRGYKRKTSGFLLADSKSTAALIGDEPFQMFQKFLGITVAVDEKRVHGIEQLLQQADKPEVILLDDAYQHRHVTPSFSIVLIDYNRPIQTDTFLPLGRLRESKSGLNRAQCVIVTKCPSSTTINAQDWRNSLHLNHTQALYFSTLSYEKPEALFNAPNLIWEKTASNKPHILIITGIVSATGLHDYVRPFASELATRSFSDHHDFTKENIQEIEKLFNSLPPNKVIITTEKDKARLVHNPFLPETMKPFLYSIGIKVEILDGKEDELNQLILNHVKA